MASPLDAPRRRRARRVVAAWVLVAGAIGLWSVGGPDPGEAVAPGSPAPPLVAAGLVAAGLAAAGTDALTLDGGGVTVLTFWATWCPACRREGPALSEIHARIAERGDRVVGVSVDRADPEAVTDAARRLGMTYPIAVTDAASADRYGVRVLPTHVIVDGEGRVTATLAGPVSERALLDAIARARRPALAAR